VLWLKQVLDIKFQGSEQQKNLAWVIVEKKFFLVSTMAYLGA
jgi:hypothetical protein